MFGYLLPPERLPPPDDRLPPELLLETPELPELLDPPEEYEEPELLDAPEEYELLYDEEELLL